MRNATAYDPGRGMPLSDDILAEAVALVRQHGTVTAAAEAAGIHRRTLGCRIKRAAERGLMGYAPVLPGFAVTKTTAELGEAGEIRRQFITQKPEPGEAFAVPDGHVVKGVSALVDADGRVERQWVKTREGGGIGTADVRAAIEAALEQWGCAAPDIAPPPAGDDDLLTIYPWADVHLGLRATADACEGDFDLAVAADRFRSTTANLLARSPNSGTALILQLGDWSHADDDLAMTPTSKHILQVSHTQLPVITCGVQLAIEGIYLALEKHALVIVKVLRGNHDRNAWIALYVALVQHFRGNQRVKIDDGEADYWFFRFGSTLIGAHHGHRLKPAEMAGAMATECREDWGETDYRLFLHGHLHHMRVHEVLGVRVECFRTLAEVDAFHSGKYGSGKSMVSITVHRENGEDGRVQINLPPTKKRAARAV